MRVLQEVICSHDGRTKPETCEQKSIWNKYVLSNTVCWTSELGEGG